MKKRSILYVISLLLATFILTGCACHGIQDPVIRKANGTFLPANLNNGLLVDNFYRYSPGCYIACYSRDAKHSAYGVGGNIYANGIIRVNGIYVSRICQPQGYFFKDISKIDYFSKLCQKRIASCKSGHCWAGGDTGGFVGIP
jgi:hypothetical protein